MLPADDADMAACIGDASTVAIPLICYCAWLKASVAQPMLMASAGVCCCQAA